MSAVETLLDAREPFKFIGKWKKSDPCISERPAEDVEYDEPHAKRRIAILESHPEVRHLYGNCHLTFLVFIFALIIHGMVAHFLTHLSYPIIVFLSFFVGGTVCQLMGVIIHEATHDLIFPNSLLNTMVLFLCNLPIPIPISASFRRYHLDHHAFQGKVHIC